LAGTMIFETKMEISDGLFVPVMLDALIEAIKTSGEGYQADGLFRLSVAVPQRNLLKSQLEQGNYDIQSNSPHLPAVVLKEWLRVLAEPLIPDSLYADCIELGKVEDHEAQDIQFGYKLQKIIDNIPLLNINVISRIVELIKDVSAQEEFNRMNINNLGIVFAPSFLRSDQITDPDKVMQESRLSKNFVCHLVKWTPNREEHKKLGPKMPTRKPPKPVNGCSPHSVSRTHKSKVKSWNTGTLKFPKPPAHRKLEKGVPVKAPTVLNKIACVPAPEDMPNTPINGSITGRSISNKNHFPPQPRSPARAAPRGTHNSNSMLKHVQMRNLQSSPFATSRPIKANKTLVASGSGSPLYHGIRKNMIASGTPTGSSSSPRSNNSSPIRSSNSSVGSPRVGTHFVFSNGSSSRRLNLNLIGQKKPAESSSSCSDSDDSDEAPKSQNLPQMPKSPPRKSPEIPKGRPRKPPSSGMGSPGPRSCSNCNSSLRKNAGFCSQCGTKNP